ncbi:NF038122 family metalloprotease [Paraglaciecola sp. 25GB23A]|uniref:NF038122 family metalloprotease n=1 Tax=Paraglaciecola sp. 25GB23A TaxID=3156068 RepID=UPI0032AF5FC8
MKKTLLAAAVASTMVVGYSQAAVINLIDVGGVTGSVAEKGFQAAADYWGKMFSNDATINLEVSFGALPPNVIGSTGSTRIDFLVEDWINGVNATKSASTIDQTAVLPTTTNAIFGVESIIGGLTSGVNVDGNNDTTVTASLDGKYASAVLYQNTSVLKAIGYDAALAGVVDGSMTFSSTFAFDFDPTNGISAGTFDFLGVAIHEMGHALGFVSGVDFLDVYGFPNGLGTQAPYGPLGYDLNDTSIFSALDMFRYSAPGVVDYRPNVDSYFSIDGGATALMGGYMSTGRYNGDGNQASHWKEEPFCGVGLGIMDPTFCFGQMGEITGLDLAAFDAMGWNLKVDALNYGSETSAQIYARLVPAPTTWALMLGALGGLVGLSRRRNVKAK